MTWADFWKALVETHAFPGAGLALLIIGATFRWFEPLNQFIETVASPIEPVLSRLFGKRVETRDPPIVMTRAYAASLRAAGDEEAARRAEERAEDHRRRLIRYGRAMMVVGVILFLLSVLLL